MIHGSQAWLSFATELEVRKTMHICFPDFKISHITRVLNGISDSLARTAQSFYNDLYFIGYYIPVWLPGPSQV